MIDLEQLKADRKAGTDGPWKIVRYDCGDGDIPDNTPMIDGPDAYDAAVVHWKGFKQKYWSSAHGDERAIDANASRISRLPDLEAAYIEAVAKLDKAVEALENIRDIEKPPVTALSGDSLNWYITAMQMAELADDALISPKPESDE